MEQSLLMGVGAGRLFVRSYDPRGNAAEFENTFSARTSSNVAYILYVHKNKTESSAHRKYDFVKNY